MAGTYICPLQACRNLTLKLFIEGHPKYLTEVIFCLFGDIFTLIADYIAWKLLKMVLEVEYMMEYQYPDFLVTEEDCWLQRKSADSTVMDRKKAVVSYKPTPAEM